MNPYRGHDDARLLGECRVELRRGSGPGGQHRNKTESAVRLTHLPTGLVATGSERRSQAANRAVALARLRERLEARFRRERPRIATTRSRAVRDREREAKQRRSARKRSRRERPQERE